MNLTEFPTILRNYMARYGKIFKWHKRATATWLINSLIFSFNVKTKIKHDTMNHF